MSQEYPPISCPLISTKGLLTAKPSGWADF